MSNTDEFLSILESGKNHEGADFSGYKLKGISLNEENFAHASFEDADLEL